MESLALKRELAVFRGKRILLTGDTGFKGSWLALWLRHLGADVTGVALPPERKQDLYAAARVHKHISHISGDIRDPKVMRKAMRKAQPEFVFHLAAQSLVRRSYADPRTTFETNLGGSVNLLETVRESPSVRALVFVTTDKCYRNREWEHGYRENDELGGRDPYSASKAAAEIVFGSYVDSFFASRKDLGAASVRAGNVLGGGDWSEDRIVPDCIRSLSRKEPIIIRNPGSTRPWQHVLEPLGGYLLLAARLHADPAKFSGSWNFGPAPGSFRTVEELAKLIVREWGSGALRVEEDPNAVHEAKFLHLNCDKARHRLEWEPKWDFERTIKETIRWYRQASPGEPALLLTQKQIKEYMDEVNS